MARILIYQPQNKLVFFNPNDPNDKGIEEIDICAANDDRWIALQLVKTKQKPYGLQVLEDRASGKDLSKTINEFKKMNREALEESDDEFEKRTKPTFVKKWFGWLLD